MLSVTSRGRLLLRLSLCVFTACSVSSCATDVTLSSISDSAASGQWEGSGGGVVSLKANRTFTTSGINWREVSEGSGCPQGQTAAGTWAFWGSDPGSPEISSALDRYTSGESINLSFDGAPQGECLINLNVTKGGSALCVSDDIEIPCSREITFVKKS